MTDRMIRTLLSRIWRYFTFKDNRKICRRASRLFTILQCNISAQHKTKWSLMAIEQPTRDCAANRSSSLLVAKNFLSTCKIFSQHKCFCVRLFLESALKSVVTNHVGQTAVSNLCSRTSFRLSQHENFFAVCLGHEISLPLYLSITDSFFVWGSQSKQLIYVDAIFVSEVAPMLYILSLSTRFISTKLMAFTQLPFSMNQWIPFFRTANDNICLFYKWP